MGDDCRGGTHGQRIVLLRPPTTGGDKGEREKTDRAGVGLGPGECWLDAFHLRRC